MPITRPKGLPPVVKVSVFPSSDSWKLRNGSWYGSTGRSMAVLKATASRAWSNAGPRVRRPASTMTNSDPSGVVTRYQARPSSSQVGRSGIPLTSRFVALPRNCSAWA